MIFQEVTKQESYQEIERHHPVTRPRTTDWCCIQKLVAQAALDCSCLVPRDPLPIPQGQGQFLMETVLPGDSLVLHRLEGDWQGCPSTAIPPGGPKLQSLGT